MHDAPAINADVTIQRRRFRLEDDGHRCAFRRLDERPSPSLMALDLTPPCYILRWTAPLPRVVAGQGPSRGVPLGEVGGPALWKYPEGGKVTVLAVIGDPVAPLLASGSVSKQRMAHGYHCAGSVQAVLFKQGRVAPSQKRANVGEICAEVGMDEKGFWLLAHPSPGASDARVGSAAPR